LKIFIDRFYLLESEGNYKRVFLRNERPLLHRSLNALEAQLDPRCSSAPAATPS